MKQLFHELAMMIFDYVTVSVVWKQLARSNYLS